MNIKWEEGAPKPVGCWGHTAVWLNGVVYVSGGYYTGGISFTINCYDPVNNSWSSPINTSYSLFAMTTMNSRLIIAGGRDKYYKITNQVLTLDSTELKYYSKMITARSDAVAAGHQRMLIITGGEDDNLKKLSSTELFDTRNRQWYKCDDLPQPHYMLQSVIVDNILYLLGGVNKDDNGSPVVFIASMDTLLTHQLKWSTIQDTPWCFAAPVSVNGTHLLIAGGSKMTGNEYTRTFDLYRLNKITHSWEVIGHIPLAINGTAAVSTADNRVIVIGGRNDKGEATNTVWIGLCERQK